MTELVVIAHNIRSTFNVGSIFRTCDGFGVHKLILSGYTPYPPMIHDERLPHIREKLLHQIHKSALGAEEIVPFEHYLSPPLQELIDDGFRIVALEQAASSISLSEYSVPAKVALLLGEEVNGIDQSLLQQCQDILEIPMKGKKESFNVSVATGIALYALTTNTRYSVSNV